MDNELQEIKDQWLALHRKGIDTLSQLVDRYLESSGVTLRAFAHMLGAPASCVCTWRTGAALISPKHSAQLADFMGLHPLVMSCYSVPARGSLSESTKFSVTTQTAIHALGINVSDLSKEIGINKKIVSRCMEQRSYAYVPIRCTKLFCEVIGISYETAKELIADYDRTLDFDLLYTIYSSIAIWRKQHGFV